VEEPDATSAVYQQDLMNRARIVLLLIVAGCDGCGGGSGSVDAAPDIDNGMCGTMLRFTGEYVDWESDTTFCGLPGTDFTIPGGATQRIIAPNGRIPDICVPDQPTTLLDITPPSSLPSCKVIPDPQPKYSLPGIAVVNKAVILAGGFWSGRTFIDGRETYDAAKAQVYVHIDGPARAVSLDASHSHGPAQAVTTNMWAPGDTGHEVFIPDVDPSGGSVTLLVAGGAIGTGSIPLVAGKMTTLSVVTH
jgi:hypothetical protein